MQPVGVLYTWGCGLTVWFTCPELFFMPAGCLTRTISPLCRQGFSTAWKRLRACKCGFIVFLQWYSPILARVLPGTAIAFTIHRFRHRCPADTATTVIHRTCAIANTNRSILDAHWMLAHAYSWVQGVCERFVLSWAHEVFRRERACCSEAWGPARPAPTSPPDPDPLNSEDSDFGTMPVNIRLNAVHRSPVCLLDAFSAYSDRHL